MGVPCGRDHTVSSPQAREPLAVVGPAAAEAAGWGREGLERKAEGGMRRPVAPLGHKVALLSFTKSWVLESDCDIPPFPAAPSQRRAQGEAGREGRRVGGFTDVSWRPQRGAPRSPGRPGLPGPRSGCCQAQDLLVVLPRPLQLGSRALFPERGRSSDKSQRR